PRNPNRASVCRHRGSTARAARRAIGPTPPGGCAAKLSANISVIGRMTQPDTWYVAFGPDKTVKTDDSATGAVRSTRTFKSEVDAKLFAMQIIAKGWSATAGTLNPHQPKQIIGSSHIERWADPGA